MRFGAVQTITPGEEISQAWNKAPLVPSPAAPVAQSLWPFPNEVTNPALTVCTACRQDNIAVPFLLPFGDSDPAHYIAVNTPMVAATVNFYRNRPLALRSSPIRP